MVEEEQDWAPKTAKAQTYFTCNTVKSNHTMMLLGT